MKKILTIFAVAMFLSIATVSAVSTYGDATVSTNSGIAVNTRTSAEADSEFDVETTDSGYNSGSAFKLSNGLNTEVKIMPSVASSIAIEKLQLRVCSRENNCTIILKEVGNNQSGEVRAAYEVQVDKEARIFGLFKKKMHIRAEIDAETGTVLRIEKPWWAGLASETNAEVVSSAAYK